MGAIALAVALGAGVVIAAQDARSRTFHAAALLAFALGLHASADLSVEEIGGGLACVGVLIGGLYATLRIRVGGHVRLTRDYLGLGDVLLLVALATGFPARELLACVLSACVIGLAWVCIDASARARGIPFATALLLGAGGSAASRYLFA